MFIGEDPETLGRNDGHEAVDRGLNKAALADDIEHLLGGALSAARPEARAAASGQDETVMMAVHYCSG